MSAGGWLHILATTRLGEADMDGAHKGLSFMGVDELAMEDALALVESYQPGGRFRNVTEQEAAREMARLLGCFTLAVETAAIYLGHFADDLTCAGFLTRLRKFGLEGLDAGVKQSNGSGWRIEERLNAALRQTLERLTGAEKLALNFSALLPAELIALPWLRVLVAKKYPEMEDDAEPGRLQLWNNLLRRLFSLRLLQPTGVIDGDGQPLLARVHRLVQKLVLFDWPEAERTWSQQIIDELIEERQTKPNR